MKKFKLEYLIYILIIISPLLDAFSFLFKGWFPNASISPTLVLRPIIPLILLCYIFITDKSQRKILISGSVLYIIYGIIHLLITKNQLRLISVGSVFQEAQYVFNYTYMIYMMYIMLWFNKNRKLTFLKESLLMSLGMYLIIIYFSILSGTSSTTYLTGTGYKSYFISGNSLCTVLLMLLGNALITLKDHKVINLILIILTGFFMTVLVGTRTGLLGFVLVLGVYILMTIMKRMGYKFSKKSVLAVIIISGVLLATAYVGANHFLQRRAEIEEESKIIDVNTGKYGHTTGNTNYFVNEIRNKREIEEGMTHAQAESYLDMYELANKLKLRANDNRTQQLIYNLYRVKNEHNIIYILFGNGFITNEGEMVLEMEFISIILNFGLFGFILYLLPMLAVLFRLIKTLKKRNNMNKIMYIISILLTFALSFMAGYVFYSSTCMLIMASLYAITEKEI